MLSIGRLLAPTRVKIIEKHRGSSDEAFRQRCIGVKQKQAELAKHHIDVLWSDYFKPETVLAR